MTKARSVVDVMLGEGGGSTRAQRYRDFHAIASTIANRARSLGVSPEDVVSVTREFNAYGRRMPSGVEGYRGLAQQAWDDVQKNGPSHKATFYATPAASGNLPRGLAYQTATSAHRYYSDPQNRAIGTAQGYKSPFEATMQPQKLSLAEQYGLLDQARGMQRDIGLLRQDVAEQDPMGQLKRDLIARNKAYEMATAPPQGGLLLESLPEAPVTTAGTPPVEVNVPAVTAYDQAPPAVEAFSAQPGLTAGAGLLSPEEQLAVQRQQDFLAGQPVNRRAQIGGALKKGASAFGGGVLGGLLLGPIGAVAGGLLGPTIVNGMTGSANFPKAPDSKPRGDGKMTEYGERVQRESRQFDRAVRSGKGGLW